MDPRFHPLVKTMVINATESVPTRVLRSQTAAALRSAPMVHPGRLSEYILGFYGTTEGRHMGCVPNRTLAYFSYQLFQNAVCLHWQRAIFE